MLGATEGTTQGKGARATLVIGTRGSKLALAQTEIVRMCLLDVHPDLDVRIETISTKGDVVQDRPLSQIGGNGVFVRQIERALLEGTVDVAVHSAKDLPSLLSPGLTIAAYMTREDPRDVLVSRDGSTLTGLSTGARVGTSSPRRACQLSALRPDLTLLDIRGNVDTRLRKLREGQYDAIVLAAAGLSRLGLLHEVSEWLEPAVILPAVAQGALAVEVREGDTAAQDLVTPLNDPATSTAVRSERAFLRGVGGSCALPIGAYGIVRGDRLILAGMIGSAHGGMVRGAIEGAVSEGQELGASLAERLLSEGGAAFLEEDAVVERPS
ncbi:MAG TPA: hydroxymethylbilane synthase [Chloroflexia bacterium]|nr:hydroxymethylbilane synthase [Chloroflexia bacterium]